MYDKAREKYCFQYNYKKYVQNNSKIELEENVFCILKKTTLFPKTIEILSKDIIITSLGKIQQM